RRKTLGNDRPLLLLGPPSPALAASDHLNSRHRTVSNTGASTVACTDAHPARADAAAQGGLPQRVTLDMAASLLHAGPDELEIAEGVRLNLCVVAVACLVRAALRDYFCLRVSSCHGRSMHQPMPGPSLVPTPFP